jgi:hypothetical protein
LTHTQTTPPPSFQKSFASQVHTGPYWIKGIVISRTEIDSERAYVVVDDGTMTIKVGGWSHQLANIKEGSIVSVRGKAKFRPEEGAGILAETVTDQSNDGPNVLFAWIIEVTAILSRQLSRQKK